MQETGSVLRDSVCDALRAQIVGGGLPPASALREERLAAELNVSRTPLREAIRQLAEEGFVEQEPRRGARVTPMTATVVREVFEVREAIEGMAARLAAQRIDAKAVADLRAYLDGLRPQIEQGDFSDTGDIVHREIFAACGNTRLQKLMTLYRAKVEWIQRAAFQMSRRLDRAYQEHESIVRALECGDAHWAEAATQRHIRNTAQELAVLLSEPPEEIRQPA